MAPMTGDPDDASRVLDAVERDPRLASVLRDGYPGRHDALDALWWRVHPLEPSPRGAPDPVEALDGLARSAFARDAGPQQLNALRSAETARARDAAALDDALLRFARATAPGPQHEHAGAADALPPSNRQPLPDAGASDGHFPGGTTSIRWVAAAAIVVIVALAVTSLVLGVRLAASESVLAGTTPVAGRDPLARFDLTQQSEDVPEATLPYDYLAPSVRRLLTPDETGLAPEYTLFGARTADDAVCLLLVFPERRIASTCVSVAEFRQHGARVSANVRRQSATSLGSSVLVAHTVTWLPDDAFQFASTVADRP